MQRNKDRYQIPNIQVVQRVRRQQHRSPFSNSLRCRRLTKGEKKCFLKKPGNFWKLISNSTTRFFFPDRTKMHFTSHYKNINLIQLKAKMRMTGIQMRCLKLNMQTDVDHPKSSECRVFRFWPKVICSWLLRGSFGEHVAWRRMAAQHKHVAGGVFWYAGSLNRCEFKNRENNQVTQVYKLS